MNNNNNQIIRFDWAMKILLRNKANFSVLEGLLTTLLGEKIVIQKLLESDQEDQFDKYNHLARNAKKINFVTLRLETWMKQHIKS